MGLGPVIHVFRSDFQEQEMILEYLLSGPIQRTSASMKIPKSLKHEKWSFPTFKRQNSIALQGLDLTFCTHIHREVFFHTYSVLLLI